MIFRVAFATVLLVLSLNISVVFGIEKANPIEKAFILASALIIALRGELDRTLVGCAIVIVFGTFVSASLTDFSAFSWDLYFRALVTVVATLLFLVTVPRVEDRDALLLLLALTPPLQVALGAVYQALGVWPMDKADVYGVVRLAGSTIPAFLGAAAATGAVAAMAYASQRDMRYLALVGVNTIILLLTGSRMATAAGAIACIGILLFGFQRNRSAKYLIIVGGALASLVVIPVLGAALLERAGSGSLQGREMIWAYLAGFARDYPLFGVGLGAQYTLIPPRIVLLTSTVAAHNEYLRLQVELGWVGGLIHLAGWLALFAATAASPMCRNRGGYLFVVIAMLIFSATDNTFTRFECISMLIVGFYGTSRVLGEREAGSARPSAPPRLLGEALPMLTRLS